jgi:hypothetical protein
MKTIALSSIILTAVCAVAATFGGCGGSGSGSGGQNAGGAGGSQTGPGSGGSTQTSGGGSTATSNGGSSANGGGGTAGGGTGGAGVGGSNGTAGGGTGGGCGNVMCPSQLPANGDPCTACEAGLDCTYDMCMSTQGAHEAICHQGHWQVKSIPCTFMCGNSTCTLQQVCVHQPEGPTQMETCKTNPCMGQTLDCSCAASLCIGNMCMDVMQPHDVDCAVIP